jgi:hypothetical protein
VESRLQNVKSQYQYACWNVPKPELLELGPTVLICWCMQIFVDQLHVKGIVLCFWRSLSYIKFWFVIYYRGFKFPQKALVLLLLENVVWICLQEKVQCFYKYDAAKPSSSSSSSSSFIGVTTHCGFQPSQWFSIPPFPYSAFSALFFPSTGYLLQSSIHLFLGLPLILLPVGFHSNTL